MKPILFVDRDGTLIEEPEDFQVDRLHKIRLCEDVIVCLRRFLQEGYELVMITNQDGLGTKSFPEKDFSKPHGFILELFRSQGITFSEVLICPHKPDDQCECRKPKLGMVLEYMQRTDWDRSRSHVIGDRDSDLQLAENMGLVGYQISRDLGWTDITKDILDAPRTAVAQRQTKETAILIEVNIDGEGNNEIQTGLGFLDHLLQQISKHGQMDLRVQAEGDLHIDDHHLVEDVAIVLGTAFKEALGTKYGIERFASTTVMDETKSEVALDLSGRAYSKFSGQFDRPDIKGLSTEMIPHFFRSFADAAQCTLHVSVDGENTHHKIESCFKSFGRTLKQASRKTGTGLASTKGSL